MSEPVSRAQWRLFVAVSLPDAVKAELQNAQSALRRAVPGDCVRWTAPAQMHLTLRFLGAVEAERVERLTLSLRQVCALFQPLQLRAQQLGFFPPRRPPRVIWAGVEDSRGDLPELHRAVVAATDDFTSEKAEGQFTGHVTLGRVKSLSRAQAEILVNRAADFSARVFGAWTAGELELIRSELSSQGPRHTVLAALRFQTPAPP